MSEPILPSEAFQELRRLVETGATGELRLQLYHGEIIGYKVVFHQKIKRTTRMLAENEQARIR